MGKVLESRKAAFLQNARVIVTESIGGLVRGFINRLKARSRVTREHAIFDLLVTESSATGLYLDITTQDDRNAAEKAWEEIKDTYNKIKEKWDALSQKVQQGLKDAGENVRENAEKMIDNINGTLKEIGQQIKMVAEKGFEAEAYSQRIVELLNNFDNKVNQFAQYLKQNDNLLYTNVKKEFGQVVEMIKDAEGQVQVITREVVIPTVTIGIRSDINPENWKDYLTQYEQYLKEIAKAAQKENYAQVKVKFIDTDGSTIEVKIDPKTLAQESTLQLTFVERLKVTLEKWIQEIKELYSQYAPKIKGWFENVEATTIAVVAAIVVGIIGLGFVLYKFVQSKGGAVTEASEYMNLIFVEHALKTDLNAIAAFVAYQSAITEAAGKVAKGVLKGAKAGVIVILMLAFIIAALIGLGVAAFALLTFAYFMWVAIAGQEEVVERVQEALRKSEAGEAGLLDIIIKEVAEIHKMIFLEKSEMFIAGQAYIVFIIGALGATLTGTVVAKLITKLKRDLTQSGGMSDAAAKRLKMYANAAGFGGVHVRG